MGEFMLALPEAAKTVMQKHIVNIKKLQILVLVISMDRLFLFFHRLFNLYLNI